MKRIGCLQIVFLLSFNKFIFAVEKQWIVDFEWKNEQNWDRLPEIDGHVIFPLETRHAVGLAKSIDLKLSKIDLPREGSLVLFRNGKLEVRFYLHSVIINVILILISLENEKSFEFVIIVKFIS